MPDISLTSQRPVIAVDGLPAEPLSADVVSIRYVESLTHDGTLEASLTNWGGSPPGYKYSEGNALQVGSLR